MYSVIFNEVIYGSYDRLRACAGGLNDSLLAPSLDLVLRIDASRRDLLSEGADLSELAVTHGLSVYDAAYLELALRRGLTVGCKDGPLQAAATRAGLRLWA